MSSTGLVQRVRRRTGEVWDQMRAAVEPAPAPDPAAPGTGVVVLAVSFETFALTQLMLLTLAEQWPSDLARRVVMVDHGSRDGTRGFLEALSSVAPVELVKHDGLSSHGTGLRYGMHWIADTERDRPPALRAGHVLILDTDVIVLRNDLIPALAAALDPRDAAVAGELQFDVGETYIHPSCMMVKLTSYFAKGAAPFVHHGAPALWFERSVHRRGERLMDVPVRSDEYIVHRGRGTLDGYGRTTAAHYHGNRRGAERWRAAEERHAARLGSGSAAQRAVEYIAARIKV